MLTIPQNVIVVKYGESLFTSITKLSGKQTVYHCFCLFLIIRAAFPSSLHVVSQNPHTTYPFLDHISLNAW